MTRSSVLCAIVIVACGIIGLKAQQPLVGRVPPPGQTTQPRPAATGLGGVEPIVKVATNLYVIPGAGGNTAVFVTNQGVVLVDTKLANNGQAILDQVKTVTDKPVTTIISTHSHADHVGSNGFFPADVQVVAHERTDENMRKMPMFQEAVHRNGLPDKMFKDRLTLFAGAEAIDLYYFGRAHTGGDALVVFRAARVMHASDILGSKALALVDNAAGGSTLEYGDTIAKAVAAIKNVTSVISGHADVMTWQDFVDYGEFNRLFAAHARAAHKAGKTPDQAAAEFVVPERLQQFGRASGRARAAGNFPQAFFELEQK